MIPKAEEVFEQNVNYLHDREKRAAVYAMKEYGRRLLDHVAERIDEESPDKELILKLKDSL